MQQDAFAVVDVDGIDELIIVPVEHILSTP
jgi:hypothetical protein